MNYEALTQNLIGMVKESQIKLGYTKTPIHLYFPAQAICHLLDTQAFLHSWNKSWQTFLSPSAMCWER